MVDVSAVKQQEAATSASQSNRQRLRSNATKETEDTSRARMDVITTPPPVRPHPRTELNASRSQHVQKVESRQKHCKNRCEMRHTHTQENTEINDAKGRAQHVFAQRSPPAGALLFAIKHRKNRCESKSKVQFRVSKVPILEFQHMPAKESHHPARRQTHQLPTTTIPPHPYLWARSHILT